jgi:glycosyltransferase involved in cell wall biosynthesis
VCNAFPVDPEKVRTILLGCDEKFHEITDADRIRTTREKYGIKGKFIFNLSTDYFHKNARNLIFAFDRLLAPGDIKATMIIAGHRYCVKGSEEIEKALTQSPQSRHIKWLEHIPEQDLCLMYNAADVFAFPSLHEGFGFPVLEAMACGTPVVAANRTSIPEVAGDAAVLVDGEDVDEIAEALREALVNESLRRSLIEKGLQQVRKFSWEKTAAETMRVYEALYEDPGAEDSLDAMEPGWQQWLRLQLMDTEHLERQVQDLNNALRLRGEHLEALLGSRTVDILRKIRSVVLSMRN